MGQFTVQKNIENNFTSFILQQHEIENDMKKVIRVHEVKTLKLTAQRKKFMIVLQKLRP